MQELAITASEKTKERDADNTTPERRDELIVEIEQLVEDGMKCSAERTRLMMQNGIQIGEDSL